ncbi:MAG: hypothetical protein M1834_006861 [Cirrosporium novae-zelandiae]|nr:MAG: hypothetical protein M1834_006861 [Cirrosporium novae-zelandiae]
MPAPPGIFSATYSNVPVYEFSAEGCHVMRRRADNWINATHILKVAKYDKPARTRILEREVQKAGVHEKVQGGYGKYQGTWIPLKDGRVLAEKNNVLEKLRPIFDFSPGDTSPPPAPKHTTAASNKARAAKAAAAAAFVPRSQSKAHVASQPRQKRLTHASVHTQFQVSEEQYENPASQIRESTENSTIASRSSVDEEYFQSQESTRKRKREEEYDAFTTQQIENELYGNEQLDYYVSLGRPRGEQIPNPPKMPNGYDFTLKVDSSGRTLLHWATAMGDAATIKKFLDLKANSWMTDDEGLTPLMFSTQFTNCAEKKTFPRVMKLLQETIQFRDPFDSTIFHHIAASSISRVKKKSAYYYCQSIINKLMETMDSTQVAQFLNIQNSSGDTALHIAVRSEASDLIRLLQGSYAASDLPNNEGETADTMIRRWRADAMKQFPFPSSLPDLTASFQEQTHKSEAAKVLSDSVIQYILSNAENVGKGYDAKIVEKEEDLVEANRILAQTVEEFTKAQKDYATLMNILDGDFPTASQQAECSKLIVENEALLEQSQEIELQHRISEEEAKTPIAAEQKSKSPEEYTKERAYLAIDLAYAQCHRSDLVRGAIQKESLAGDGTKVKAYHDMIMGALQMPAVDSFDDFMPELVDSIVVDEKSDEVEPHTPPAQLFPSV